jgi:hypothetical protein
MSTTRMKAIVGSTAALVACPGLAIALAAAALASPLLFVTIVAGRSRRA